MPSVRPGSLLTGSYSYDSASRNISGTSSMGEYALHEVRLQLPLGQELVLDAFAEMTIYPGSSINFAATDSAQFSGSEVDALIDCGLVQFPPAYIADGGNAPVTMPTVPPPLDNLCYGAEFLYSDASQNLLHGLLTSTYLVPEPNSLAILCALAGLLGTRRGVRAG